MKKRITISVFALIFLFISTLGYLGFSNLSAAKGLNSFISKGQLNGAITESEKLANKYGQLQGFLSLPIIKQSINVFGLDFAANKSDYQALIKALPYLAGVEKPQRYLVSFQNTAEARGTGGILGAFAILKIDKGKLTVEQIGRAHV